MTFYWTERMTLISIQISISVIKKEHCLDKHKLSFGKYTCNIISYITEGKNL
jgi:hypothetical protein